jgi:SAM-dependent methyltransferase
MPSLDWNRQVWDQQFDWSQDGNEWSQPWGSPYGQWFSTIMPRIGAFLPCESVLEIAPGHGRWTRFLLKYCKTYLGIDLSVKCVQACRERFHNARFEVNDGVSLQAAGQGKYDLVFSFDSLVHADWESVGGYIPQILDLLGTRGVCFMHHSNLGEQGGISYGQRSEDVSSARVMNAVEQNDGIILAQELVTWGDVQVSDCFTLFGRKEGWGHLQPFLYSDTTNVLSSEASRSQMVYKHYDFCRDN